MGPVMLNPTFFPSAKHIAVVPAAGTGQRFGTAVPKQYALIAGQAMLVRTVERLLAFARFDAVCVVVSPNDAWAMQALAPLFCDRLQVMFEGGQTRADTVASALEALSAQGVPLGAWIWVHDAARPGVTLDVLKRLEAALVPTQAVIATLPVADTVKRAARDGALAFSAATLDRSDLYLAQTPQVAQLSVLRSALQMASKNHAPLTDEASALELNGVAVGLVLGSNRNFKITTAQDAAMMEALMTQTTQMTQMTHAAAKMPALRIGEGMDVHALVLGRPLILGGVTIEHTHGLLGHSDADALCHAATDALLGAAGLGDIGRMFPDTDAQYAGADSTVLLAKAYQAVQALGWALVNLDATIIAQAPKLAAHLPKMQARLAQVLGCEPNQFNIKAKTNENLGFLGRKEGIECRVSVLLAAVTPASA